MLSANSRFWGTNRLLEDGVERHGEWHAPHLGQAEEKVYTVTQRDLNRVDMISYRAYGTVQLWWVILHYNGIADPFSLQPGDRLRIPSIRDVNSVLANLRNEGSRIIEAGDPPKRVFNFTPAIVTPFQRLRPLGTAEPDVTITPDPGFNFGFEVPSGLVGALHFQIEVSLFADFSSILMSRLTFSSQLNWFYYDPYVNSQAGGWMAFPAEGVDGELYDGGTIYYHVTGTDPLIHGNRYFFRYRAWANETEGVWYAPPPILY